MSSHETKMWKSDQLKVSHYHPKPQEMYAKMFQWFLCRKWFTPMSVKRRSATQADFTFFPRNDDRCRRIFYPHLTNLCAGNNVFSILQFEGFDLKFELRTFLFKDSACNIPFQVYEFALW